MSIMLLLFDAALVLALYVCAFVTMTLVNP